MLALYVIDGPHTGRRLISNPPGIPEKPYHAAISGAIGGYLIWGKYSAINYQIVLYLTSRVLVGMLVLARKKGLQPFARERVNRNTYPLTAAAVWGAVMLLFEEYPDVLHLSLKRSMDEVYRYSFLPWRQI